MESRRQNSGNSGKALGLAVMVMHLVVFVVMGCGEG
jgi:hypothetical protein